jgi:DNA-binding transcriptional ArsR family regulator
MVNYRTSRLDRTFAALADPTRRALLARLDEVESLSVSELAQPFKVSLPAVMKHLDVLSDAGLIARSKTGRTVRCRLTAHAMEEAYRWLDRYQRFWTEKLDRLAVFLEEEESRCPPPPPSQVSPSSAATTRRQRNSSAPGPARKR